jgi:DNA-binding transcriptional ArsR family regulator
MKEAAHYKRQARLLRALANETRLAIIDRLSRGECQVGELVRLIDRDQSTVSKHLAILREAGVLDDERRGNMVFYRLVTPCILEFFSCAARVIKERR